MSFAHAIAPYRGSWLWSCQRGIVQGMGMSGSRKLAVRNCLEVRADYRRLMEMLGNPNRRRAA